MTDYIEMSEILEKIIAESGESRVRELAMSFKSEIDGKISAFEAYIDEQYAIMEDGISEGQQ